MTYQIIVLKLSGEVLAGAEISSANIDAQQLEHYTNEIAQAHSLGIGIAIVIGGGNIWRGKEAAKLGIPREKGDYMGLLATIMNSIALQHALACKGLPAVLMNRIKMPLIGEEYDPVRAKSYLNQQKIVVLGGGTGEVGCTTDTAAALTAVELGADSCIKGTQVDGVYSQDPKYNKEATFYSTLTLQEAIEQRLGIMDLGALKMCAKNGITIKVYNATKIGALAQLLAGEKLGTLLST